MDDAATHSRWEWGSRTHRKQDYSEDEEEVTDVYDSPISGLLLRGGGSEEWKEMSAGAHNKTSVDKDTHTSLCSLAFSSEEGVGEKRY